VGGKTLTVYIGWKDGDRPFLVAPTVQDAIWMMCSQFCNFQGSREQEWICAFVSADCSRLRWTLRVTGDGDPYVLYVEAFNLEP
jgi:hypothetical protein